MSFFINFSSVAGGITTIDDIIKLKKVLINQEGKIESALRAIKIENGEESSTIGYLPAAAAIHSVGRFDNKFCQLIELYSDSAN